VKLRPCRRRGVESTAEPRAKTGRHRAGWLGGGYISDWKRRAPTSSPAHEQVSGPRGKGWLQVRVVPSCVIVTEAVLEPSKRIISLRVEWVGLWPW